ncbi:MAG: chromosomal replication initiator protein DnaA [Vampirovibrio sp.]|nr:chromosomal replication initiator protein DnaA [Vampirovibrio sp.]
MHTQQQMITSLNGSDDQAVWCQVQEQLRSQLTQPSYETWISGLVYGGVTEGTVQLFAETAFNADWVLKHYRNTLKKVFKAVTGHAHEIHVGVCEQAAETPQGKAFQETGAQEAWVPPAAHTAAPKARLNPKYTFETFVVGQHNRFCHAAALAVAENPAQSYNPYFIYGGVGLGKTHLAQAVGHFVSEHHPDLKVKYVTAEQFTNDLITALGSKAMNSFRDRYRKIDVLIIDDIQFLEGKERTQEEVFHTFNALHEAGKQIILASDRPPKHLAGLEARLRSRFEWGLITDIHVPDLETRIAILQRKAQREHLQVPDDILAYIAEMTPNNIRELEGALNKVAAYSMLTHTPLDLPTVKSVLGVQVDPARLSLENMIDVVAQYYHLRASDLKSPSRAKDISHARQMAIYLIRTMTEASFPKIGKVLGGRKHTTILYAFEKIQQAMEHHPVMAQQIQEMTARIKSNCIR